MIDGVTDLKRLHDENERLRTVLTVVAHAWEQGDDATVAITLGAFLERLYDQEAIPDTEAS